MKTHLKLKIFLRGITKECKEFLSVYLEKDKDNKSGGEWNHMRDFIYIKCCTKGFFSEISILDDKWLLMPLDVVVLHLLALS